MNFLMGKKEPPKKEGVLQPLKTPEQFSYTPREPVKKVSIQDQVAQAAKLNEKAFSKDILKDKRKYLIFLTEKTEEINRNHKDLTEKEKVQRIRQKQLQEREDRYQRRRFQQDLREEELREQQKLQELKERELQEQERLLKEQKASATIQTSSSLDLIEQSRPEEEQFE